MGLRNNQNNRGRHMLNRRNIVAGLGAVAAASQVPAWAQSGWSSPVIDMHFHMRADPAANIAHQVGAGVTAANLLVRGDAAAQVAALQAQNAAMFPCWMASSDVTRPEAEQILTQAVKAGARGIGELKYHVAADGPEMRRMYDLCAELDVPVLIHFQEVGQASAAGTYNAGIKHFAPVIRQYHKTKFILHADAFWANVSADYDEKDPYPTGPVVAGGVSDKILSDFENVQGDLASNSANNFLSRDAAFTRDFLKRHQDRLHFGSDCNCEDGKGGGAAQNSDRVAPRIRGKCVARETLGLLTASTTPEVFRKLVWTNAHRLVKLPA
ncbi:MAG: putative metal-dependent hydrolase of the TIM-barrel fold protein [Alphaproteobacteria bacterium]|nr:putative metal-dependent hydrolase of the TIM-barrel fold protein [Alphaproteobacteria bacterium]